MAHPNNNPFAQIVAGPGQKDPPPIIVKQGPGTRPNFVQGGFKPGGNLDPQAQFDLLVRNISPSDRTRPQVSVASSGIVRRPSSSSFGGSSFGGSSFRGSPFGGSGFGNRLVGGNIVSTSTKRGPQMADNSKTIEQLISEFTKQSDAARASGEQRFQDLLNSFAGINEQVQGTLANATAQAEKFGQTARQDLAAQTAQARAQASQNAVSRGLGNSTVAANLQRGISQDQLRALTGINEQVAQQKAGLLGQQATGQFNLGKLGIDTQLSRIDQGPDTSVFLNLIQALANASK